MYGEEEEHEDGQAREGLSPAGWAAAGAAVVGGIVLVALLLFGGGDSYVVKVRFINAGQLVKGNPVQTGGVAIGSVDRIAITPDGQAEVRLKVKRDHAPLRAGTRASIRQFSQSGIANRYVDLKMPPGESREIPDGGRIGIDETSTAVDLDQVFNTLDAETRRSLQGFFKGQAAQFRGRGEEANRGLVYLNPALSTSSRLFGELTRDTPVLERFLVDSSRLVTTLAERRDRLASLIGDLDRTTAAVGSQKAALASSIEQLPPFMRRANTTFVNLRAALRDVDPLVEASRPVARRLGPFLEQARGLAADARPTVRDLSLTIRRRGRRNDLIDLFRGVPRLADMALASRRRSVVPGGRRIPVGRVPGAFPETIRALRRGAPEIGFARPYTEDLLGWFDDFSTTGANYDALGANSRGHIMLFEGIFGTRERPRMPALGSPIRSGQFKRCPGSAEPPAPDGSNVLSRAEQEALNCSESSRAMRNP